MDATRRSQVAFHLTAAPAFGSLPAEVSMVPALLAPYRDVTRLRHDFPVILAEDGIPAQALSTALDRALAAIAPRGATGERTRRICLQLEQELRERVAAGETGRLSALWDGAASKLGIWTDDASRETLGAARKALAADGELLGCDSAMPRKLVEHAWRVEQRSRLRTLQDEIDGLIVTLSDILKADFVRSAPGRDPAVLRVAVGTAFQDAFDFDAMSRVLTRGKPVASTLPKSRRARIEWALSVLRAPPLPAPGGDLEKGLDDFVVDSAAAAARAFRKRLPRVIDLIKAMAIARLEAEGRYVDAEHDPFFAGFGPGALTRDDLARFPEYLVCITIGERKSEDLSSLVDLLSADIPVKALVIAEDAIGASPAGDGAPTLAASRLGQMVIGLDDVFVLQAPASHLVAMIDGLRDGLAFRGPALFSVFAPAAVPGGLAPYLVAAAALQGRAFPAFVYDPKAGQTVAERLSLDANPQPDDDWTTLDFVYEDASHQRCREAMAFTFADFVLCAPAHAQHFARAGVANGLVPVADWIAGPAPEGEQAAPFVWALSADGQLERVVVHEKIVVAARRCRDQWHRLRDLAKPPVSVVAPAVVEAAPAATPAQPAPVAPAETEPKAAGSDEPYIETPRCASCNECTNLNGKLFVYNADKQAVIGDLNAGTYRDLVEAAENCPVSIIHPGKPRNPKEPGLDELVQRAEPFV